MDPPLGLNGTLSLQKIVEVGVACFPLFKPPFRRACSYSPASVGLGLATLGWAISPASRFRLVLAGDSFSVGLQRPVLCLVAVSSWGCSSGLFPPVPVLLGWPLDGFERREC